MAKLPPITISSGEGHVRDDRIVMIQRPFSRLRSLPVLFAVIALTVGVFLVFARPPGEGLDESLHFYRAWSLAHGVLANNGHLGADVPQCITTYMNRFASEANKPGAFSFSQFWQSPSHCSQRPVFQDFGTTVFYGPVAYLPSTVAIFVLDHLGASLPIVYFGGRLANLLMFVVLYGLAILCIPTGKKVLFVLGLLPTMLLLASSYSADPMTVALAVLSVSLILRTFRLAEPHWPTLCLVGLALVGLALTKPTLFLFAPLIFLIPTRVLGRARHPRIIQSIAVLAIGTLAGIWSVIARFSSLIAPYYGINSNAQLHFIFHHPISYLGILARTVFDGTGESRWIPGFFYSDGYYRPFGHDSIFAPIGVIIIGSLTLLYAYRLQFGTRRLSTGRWTDPIVWLPLTILALGFLAIETTLYVYGTPVKLLYTLAQGRYFYPLAALPLISINFYWEESEERHSTRWVVLGTSLMLIWLILKTFVHVYNL
jgi:uncharacterized membrane protein